MTFSALASAADLAFLTRRFVIPLLIDSATFTKNDWNCREKKRKRKANTKERERKKKERKESTAWLCVNLFSSACSVFRFVRLTTSTLNFFFGFSF